jgi:glycosyltransferase involved in cell wall biosynthesis
MKRSRQRARARTRAGSAGTVPGIMCADVGGRPGGPAPVGEHLTVSVICPCRNEAGNVAVVVERLPAFGAATELIFVEGGSRDGTRAEIERQIERHPELDVRLLAQPGTGKADAVRAGFAAAKGDVVMVLDGDVSVAPEELRAFYRAVVEGGGGLVNGSRFMLPMEAGAMRPLNRLGNRAFALLLGAIIGQPLTDALCGAKALLRHDYEAMASGRYSFGHLDPFGDFDLLFGAARLDLPIVEVPVRYRARRYGRTNIKRFRDGWSLLVMSLLTYRRLRAAGVNDVPAR